MKKRYIYKNTISSGTAEGDIVEIIKEENENVSLPNGYELERIEELDQTF